LPKIVTADHFTSIGTRVDIPFTFQRNREPKTLNYQVFTSYVQSSLAVKMTDFDAISFTLS